MIRSDGNKCSAVFMWWDIWIGPGQDGPLVLRARLGTPKPKVSALEGPLDAGNNYFLFALCRWKNHKGLPINEVTLESGRGEASQKTRPKKVIGTIKEEGDGHPKNEPK